MKLLYDLISTQHGGVHSKFHGGGEYAKAVFMEIVKQNADQQLFGLYNINLIVDAEVSQICNENNIKMVGINNKYDLLSIIEKNTIDRFYSPLCEDYYDVNFGDVEVYLTIHGLRDLELPRDKYEIKYARDYISVLKYIYKSVLKNKFFDMQKDRIERLLSKKPKRVFVPSLHTKYAIMKFFPQISSDILKLYYSPTKTSELKKIQDTSILTKLNIIENQYFLMVSGDRWLKNSYRAVLAFDNIFNNRNINTKVLILGVTNSKIFGRLKNKEKFIFADYVSGNELEVLYKNAFAFIYPTLNEGFGYPPLEAMKYGTVVAASAVSSITEVCGDGVLYFNPYFIDEIETRILNIIYEDNSELKIRAIKRYNYISKKQSEMLEALAKEILE